MTFTKFEELLHTKYPEATAHMHGKYGGTEKNMKVEINFHDDGKAYCFYGSYKDILNKVQIPVVYRTDIDRCKASLNRLLEEHGRDDPFFGLAIDNSLDIARCEQYLQEVESGKYIIIE